MVVIDEHGAALAAALPGRAERLQCIFEYVYFARPDSHALRAATSTSAQGARAASSRASTRCEADVVDPGARLRRAARRIGYAEESGIPFELGLIRSHYVGRTFIEPQQSIRHFGVKLKLNPMRAVLEGKRVVVVDDSIVRGTTSRKIVKMLRDAGAREVHLRISSPADARGPATTASTRRRAAELIASSHTADGDRRYVTADSLGYLSLDGLLDGRRLRPGPLLRRLLHRRLPASPSSPTRSRPAPLFDA